MAAPRRKASVLLVDDDDLLRWSLIKELGKIGFRMTGVPTGEEALEVAAKEPPDLVLLDLRLPGMDGLEVLDRLRARLPGIVVLIVTGHADIGLAVEATRKGARDFITKPFILDDVALRMERALEAVVMEEEVRTYRRERKKAGAVDAVVARDAGFRRVVELVMKIAASDAPTVLLLGASGTGKGILASLLHNVSERRDAPFLEVNCSALPETLLESEVFGHETGAFTSAVGRKRGLFELAHGGTLFLDEIGDLPLTMQSKVLSFLETRRFRRVGGVEEIEVDVRIIAATNKNLKHLIGQGAFREDLYYRLCFLPVEIPPLRERQEDIAELAIRFLRGANESYRKHVEDLSPEAVRLLERYRWPGNVRELKSVIERAVLLAAGQWILPEDLPAEIRREEAEDATSVLIPGGFPAGGIPLEDAERMLIQAALGEAGGNQSRAARLLRISRDTLRYRMRKYGLLTSRD